MSIYDPTPDLDALEDHLLALVRSAPTDPEQLHLFLIVIAQIKTSITRLQSIVANVEKECALSIQHRFIENK